VSRVYLAIIFAAAIASPSTARSLTDAEIVQSIILASRAEYFATGHPYACAYDHARNGSYCGRRSAYSRPGGYEPKCYPKDISPLALEPEFDVKT